MAVISVPISIHSRSELILSLVAPQKEGSHGSQFSFYLTALPLGVAEKPGSSKGPDMVLQGEAG